MRALTLGVLNGLMERLAGAESGRQRSPGHSHTARVRMGGGGAMVVVVWERSFFVFVLCVVLFVSQGARQRRRDEVEDENGFGRCRFWLAALPGVWWWCIVNAARRQQLQPAQRASHSAGRFECGVYNIKIRMLRPFDEMKCPACIHLMARVR